MATFGTALPALPPCSAAPSGGRLLHFALRTKFRNNRIRLFTQILIYQREFYAMPHGVDSFRAYAHAVAQFPGKLFRFLRDRPAPFALRKTAAGHNRMLMFAEQATRSRRLLDGAYGQQAFHKNFQQFHKAAVLLYGNNQPLVLVAEMLLHKLRRFPVA